jgi:predicted transcriptional regulator
MRMVVGIRPGKHPGKRARQASSHTQEPMPTVWFALWRQLAGVLSDENHALLRLMQEKQPRTVLVLELAELSDHRVSGVAGLTREERT